MQNSAAVLNVRTSLGFFFQSMLTGSIYFTILAKNFSFTNPLIDFTKGFSVLTSEFTGHSVRENNTYKIYRKGPGLISIQENSISSN